MVLWLLSSVIVKITMCLCHSFGHDLLTGNGNQLFHELYISLVENQIPHKICVQQKEESEFDSTNLAFFKIHKKYLSCLCII